MLVRALPPARGVLIILAQIVGGIVAAAIASAFLTGPLTVRTSLGGGTSISQGLFIEMFLTMFLVVTVFFLTAEQHKANRVAPIGIGLALFVAMLAGTYFTDAGLN